MQALGCRFVVGLVLLLALCPVQADTVYLNQGSRLQGEVRTMSDDQLRLETDFAGTLTLDREQIAGVTTDKPIPIVVGDHKRVNRRLRYDRQADKQYIEAPQTDSVERKLALTHVASIRPQTIARRKRQARIEQYTLPEYDTNDALNKPRWSGTARLGIDGKSGNSRETNLTASISALRSTGVTRLDLLASARRSTTNGDETSADYLGEAGYEHDFSPRWYGFVKQSVERDKFQDYGLRSLTTVGPGYFVIRKRRLIFKVRGGLGYEYIRHYKNGQDSDEALVASFGWHYAQLFGRYLELSHDLDVYPQLTDSPASHFSLKSVLAASVPIADSPDWAISAQLEHEYRNKPEKADTDKLDTVYSLAIERSF